MWRVIALFVVVIGASGILRATDLQAESKEAFDLRNQLLRLENEIRILEQEKDEIEAEVLKPGSILLDVRLIDPAIRDASELNETVTEPKGCEFADIRRWPVVLISRKELQCFITYHIITNPALKTRSQHGKHLRQLLERDKAARADAKKDVKRLSQEIARINEQIQELNRQGTDRATRQKTPPTSGPAVYTDLEGKRRVGGSVTSKMQTDREGVRHITATTAIDGKKVEIILTTTGQRRSSGEDVVMELMGTVDIKGYRDGLFAHGELVLKPDGRALVNLKRVESVRYLNSLRFNMNAVEGSSSAAGGLLGIKAKEPPAE